MNVLLLEPDIQLGRIYSQALRRAGHNTEWQCDAQSAIEKAETFTPDIVVLELQLARHNGVEFLYEFRSYPDWQSIPTLLHTNVSSFPNNQDLLERLGVKAILYKPQTSITQLISSVEQLLISA